MAEKKKKKTPPLKKGATKTLASKSPKKKAGAKKPVKGKTAGRPKLTKPASKSVKKKTVPVSSGKGKTLRGPKLTKPMTKPATKKTAVSRKPAPKKVVARMKTPVKAKVTVKVKTKAASKTPAVADILKDIKRSLITRREAIVKEAKEEIAKYISGENRQLVDTALDDGDWAVVDISEDINLRRLAAHRKALHDIDEALRKIAEGSYGTCEECGEPIGEKRLSVLPAATLCVVCQGNKERLEAIENAAPSV